MRPLKTRVERMKYLTSTKRGSRFECKTINEVRFKNRLHLKTMEEARKLKSGSQQKLARPSREWYSGRHVGKCEAWRCELRVGKKAHQGGGKKIFMYGEDS